MALTWINQHITLDPEVRFGKPTIRGTRVAVEDVLNLLRSGTPFEEIPHEYPDMTRDDVLAAIAYATDLVRSEEVMALA